MNPIYRHTKITHLILLVMTLVLLSACAANKPYYKEKHPDLIEVPHDRIDYEVVVLGNVGELGSSENKILKTVKRELDPAVNRSIIFNGNFLSEGSYVPRNSNVYKSQAELIKTCINEFKNLSNEVYFAPAENEWSDGENVNVQAVVESQLFIEQITEKTGIVYPDLGCPVSDAIDVGADLVVVFVNSTWLLNQRDLDQENDPVCGLSNYVDVSSKIQNIVSSNKLKNILIITHHPVFSNGETAGNFPAKSHLKPLPIIGSVKNGLRKILGNSNHFSHPTYEKYRSAMLSGVRNCEGCTIVSSHENNLQYEEKNLNHYVNTGVSSMVDYVRKGGDNAFASQKAGFSKFIHTNDRELWLEFFAYDESCSCFKIEYQKRLHKIQPIVINMRDFIADHKIDSIVLHASNKYGEGSFGVSDGYRKSWGTDIKAPYLWLGDHGLNIVKQGGGDQTLSLRLEDGDEAQYVLRSIDKNVDKLVDPELRNTFVQTSIQGGISSSHPYGALVIPRLAEAIDILHTVPKVVYLPGQLELGDYNEKFANDLYLMEQRPAGNIAKHKIFGNAEKSVSTVKMISILHNGKGRIDQKELARCRMLDMLIGDWDRHDDQWRWIKYEDESGKALYRPMPRDRDQVFFKNKALGSFIPTRPYFNPGLRSFENKVDFVFGLNFNARHFDRTFLNGLTKEDFVAAAKLVQDNITDEVIEEAFMAWPQAIRDNDAEEISEKLKARRVDLQEYAAEFYDYLYEEVDIVGTKGKDEFELVVEKDRADLNVYTQKKKEKKLIYSNVIDLSTSEEIRLFGLGGDDTFTLSGDDLKSTVRIVGGDGHDVINNNTVASKKVLVYDLVDEVEVKGNYKSKLSTRNAVNVYDRKDFKLDRKLLHPFLTLYTDEGLGVSLKYRWRTHNFRSNPHKSNNVLSLNYYYRLASIRHYYRGTIKSVFGKWDLSPNYEITAPTFVQYYYGLGNEYVAPEELFESEPDPSFQNFVVQGSSINFDPKISRQVKNAGVLKLGVGLRYIDFKESNDDRNLFYLSESSDLSADDLNDAFYGNLNISLVKQNLDQDLNPRRGYKYTFGYSFHANLVDVSTNHHRVESDIQMYIPLGPKPNVVFSTDLGFKYNFGDYEFFNANYLAGDRKLRGFWSDRFAGDGFVYQSSDLRVKVFKFGKSVPTTFGVFGSFDHGRTFLEGDNNSDWHYSYGGGFFFAPLDIIGFKLGYHAAESDGQIKLISSLRI